MNLARLLSALALALSVSTVCLRAADAGDLTHWPAGADPALVGRRVAENYSARKFEYEAGNPKRPFVRYPEVCAWYGSLEIAQLTGDTDLMHRLIARYDRFFTPEGQARISDKAHVDYRVVGTVPFELFIQTKDPKFLPIGRHYADAQWEHPTPDGITGEARYWVDDMYMISILQAQAFRATGEQKYLNRAALAIAAYLDKLQQPNGLFFHAADSPYFWARGNGWFAAGMTEILRSLPADHPKRARIMAGYRTMMASLLKLQGPDGRWRQLLDQPDFWPETSGTGMFAFALVTGVKQGWLPAETYAPAARKAWLGLVASLDADANVADVCVGTNTSASEVGHDPATQLTYYRERKRQSGDLHGQAPILWTAAALLRN